MLAPPPSLNGPGSAPRRQGHAPSPPWLLPCLAPSFPWHRPLPCNFAPRSSIWLRTPGLCVLLHLWDAAVRRQEAQCLDSQHVSGQIWSVESALADSSFHPRPLPWKWHFPGSNTRLAVTLKWRVGTSGPPPLDSDLAGNLGGYRS